MTETGAWLLSIKLTGEMANCLQSFSLKLCSNLDAVFPRGPYIATTTTTSATALTAKQ